MQLVVLAHEPSVLLAHGKHVLLGNGYLIGTLFSERCKLSLPLVGLREIVEKALDERRRLDPKRLVITQSRKLCLQLRVLGRSSLRARTAAVQHNATQRAQRTLAGPQRTGATITMDGGVPSLRELKTAFWFKLGPSRHGRLEPLILIMFDCRRCTMGRWPPSVPLSSGTR